MSLDHSLDAKLHLTIGKALAPLREQGVLIIGSGTIVHEFDDAEANISFANIVDHAVTALSSSERFYSSSHKNTSYSNSFSNLCNPKSTKTYTKKKKKKKKPGVATRLLVLYD
jgi:aromatic ring-opening dioxygenase catalytic subunit (LigB family)